jgi:hypothetical protein
METAGKCGFEGGKEEDHPDSGGADDYDDSEDPDDFDDSEW